MVDHLKAYSDEIKELEREITLFHANAVNEILNTSKKIKILSLAGISILLWLFPSIPSIFILN